MPDGFSIITFLAAITHAKNTATLILDAPKSLEKAELEYKLAALTKTLTQLEIQARDFEQMLQEKDLRITEFEDLLKFKSKLVHKDGMYFVSDEDGNTTGEPFCSRCWEIDQKATHLHQIEDDYFKCANCKNFFGKRKQLNSSDGYY